MKKPILRRPAKALQPDAQAWLDLIQIAAKMGIRPSGRSALGANLLLPLRGNANDKGTAFAGSVYSAMVLRGWLAVRTLLDSEGLRAPIVIKDAHIEYRYPALNDGIATCIRPPRSLIKGFLTALRSGGNARICLRVEFRSAGKKAAAFEGLYVALGKGKKKEGR